MKIKRTAVLLLAVAALLPVAEVGATVLNVGCPTRAGFTYNPNAVLLIDGYLVGEMTPGNGEGPSTVADERFAALKTTDILSLRIVCNFYAEAGTMRHVIAVVTKSGVETMLTSYLNDLVREQEAHRAAHGSYTTSLNALRFFEKRMLLPLTISEENGGWSAIVTFAEGNLGCDVTVGGAAATVGRKSGQVVCRPATVT